MSEEKKLICQYPIIKNPNIPNCQKEATHHDRYGWAWCDKHSVESDFIIPKAKETP